MSLAWQLKRQANALCLAGAMTRYMSEYTFAIRASGHRVGRYDPHALHRVAARLEGRQLPQERIALRKLRGLVAGETPVNAEVHLAFRTDCKSKRAVVNRMFISLRCRTLST
jgi:hypothetical protein